MSRRTTRILVIGLVVTALALAIATGLYLQGLAEEAQEQRAQPTSHSGPAPLPSSVPLAAVLTR